MSFDREPRSRAAALARFAHRVIARLSDVGLAHTASSLSFTTLLGVVPFATVALTLAARVPVFAQWMTGLELFLLRQLLPAMPSADLHLQIAGFIDKATRLTGVSVLLLSATAFVATATIERAINRIWGMDRPRPWPRRMLICALGVTVGPLIVAASLAALTSFLLEMGIAGPLRSMFRHQVLKPVPITLFTFALMLGYMILPARKVPWRHALVGAFAAAIGLSAAKDLFGLYLVSVPTYELVYGALAAVPVFLVWIYVCWIIVLVGAAITATLTDPHRGRNDIVTDGRGV